MKKKNTISGVTFSFKPVDEKKPHFFNENIRFQYNYNKTQECRRVVFQPAWKKEEKRM